eukprot:m.209600 g.209600  ORF g.209600 m.209600 type:complete len:126 (+) comp18990_c0_seq1:218-595(+)
MSCSIGLTLCESLQSTSPAYGGLDKLKEYCLNRLPRQLERWSVMLGDKPFMTGNDVTVADLKVYDTFRKLKIYCADPQIASNPFQAHPTLQAFISRVEELPQMKTYMESDAYIARPLNNPHANFK